MFNSYNIYKDYSYLGRLYKNTLFTFIRRIIMKLSTFNLNYETSWQICIVFCLAALMMMSPELAFADESTNDDGISSVLCNVVGKLTGAIGRAVVTIAVVVLGIGLFIGKLSWSLAIATAIGIGMIFSAGIIVNWLSGTAASCGTT